MAVLIAPALVAAGVTGTIFGVATATVLAQVIVIGVGLGISMLASIIFKPTQPKPSDGQFMIRQSAASRFRCYGRVKVAGVLMFANTKAGVLDRVFAMGQGEIDAVEEHWIDDVLVPLAGDAVGGKYSGKCRLEFRLGTDAPAVYSTLIDAWPEFWTTAHLGKGIPSAYMQQFQTPGERMGDIWPNGGNTLYRQVQRGAKIRALSGGFLPRAWGDNAALVILDYLTHEDGLGLSDSWIENAILTWAEAQLVCDEFVPVPGAADERRYRIWTRYLLSERPADVLARMMQACDAVIYPTPGAGLAIKVGQWEEPTVTIDDDAIVSFSEVGYGRDVMTTANTVRAQFTSPDLDYQETDVDPWIDEADVAERGEFAADLDLFAVPSHSQARRLLKVAAHRLNPNWVAKLTCNLRALPVMGERFINVQCAELGLADTFEVLNVRLLIEGTILTGVEVQVQSLSAEAYAWDVVARTTDAGTAPSVPDILIGDNTIPLPTGFGVAMSADVAVLAWDAPPDDFLAVDARYKRTASADWLAIPVADEATSVPVLLMTGEEYEFQIRHRSTPTDRVSDWTPAEVLTIDELAAEDYGHITDTAIVEEWGAITEPAGAVTDYGTVA